jgi:hypothetical protein
MQVFPIAALLVLLPTVVCHWILSGGIAKPLEDVTSSVALVMYFAAVSLPTDQFRRVMFLTLSLWLTNNLAVGSIGGIFTNLVEAGSMLLGYIRAKSLTAVT